jgi:hypothetical protein
MSSVPQNLHDIHRFLGENAGGWLRNTVNAPGTTCSTCRTPTGGYARCLPCKEQAEGPYGGRLADQVASIAYAVRGSQSGYVMHGYKTKPPLRPIREHVTYVACLILLALLEHSRCAGRLMGAPITYWSVVPSLPSAARTGAHPLRALVAGVAPGVEVPLFASPAAARPREVNPQHFSAGTSIPGAAHALVIDDTWVRGGHEQSAALALRDAGAGIVSVLTVARWINPDYGPSAHFMRTLSKDFDPAVCPWTAGDCPA